MKKKLREDITVIVILYNTPFKKIENLKNFRNFKLIILEQGSLYNSKKEIQKILGFKFRYYYSKKNLGLSKGINFLIKKTKTKYCFITEPDILITENSILNLKKIITLNENYLLCAPRFNKKRMKKKYEIKKNIDLSCVLFKTEKMIKFVFYDEDFFFFWTDVDLIKRVNRSNFKMVISNNSHAKHFMSASSETTIYVNFLREKSYKLGEFIFDYKYDNVRFLKIFRQFFQSFLKSLIFMILLNKKKFLKNFGYFCGIIEFVIYLIKK